MLFLMKAKIAYKSVLTVSFVTFIQNNVYIITKVKRRLEFSCFHFCFFFFFQISISMLSYQLAWPPSEYWFASAFVSHDVWKTVQKPAPD